MPRVFTSTTIALFVAATGLAAQDTTIKSETKIKADDAKVVTMTGCLEGTRSSYLLSHPAIAGDKNSRRSPIGTTGTVISSYALSPQADVDLSPFIGDTVEVTGVLIAPGKSNDDAKIEVKERTETKVEGAPDQHTETKSSVKVPRGPFQQFSVVSVKSISPRCS